MVMAREVAWFRNMDGTFTVTWTMNGNVRVALFKREDSAVRFANMLDTTGALPTESDVVLAEESLQELEQAAETPAESRRDRIRAERALADLERTMRETTPEDRRTDIERREIERLRETESYESLASLEPYTYRRRDVAVRRHSRRSRRF